METHHRGRDSEGGASGRRGGEGSLRAEEGVGIKKRVEAHAGRDGEGRGIQYKRKKERKGRETGEEGGLWMRGD